MEPELSLPCSQKRATANAVCCHSYAELNLWENAVNSNVRASGVYDYHWVYADRP